MKRGVAPFLRKGKKKKNKDHNKKIEFKCLNNDGLNFVKPSVGHRRLLSLLTIL